MQLALARHAALAGEGGEAADVAHQHGHLQLAAAQDPLGRLRIRQDLCHHPGRHVALEGAAQPEPFARLP